MAYSEEEIFIYCLKHPITLEIRYIGKATDINKRLKRHLLDSNSRNTPVYCWMRKLIKQKLIPIIEVLKISSVSNWDVDEIAAIKEYREKGFRLLNVADGGNKPYCGIETRKSNGRVNANTVHSDPKKKRIWYLKQQLGSYFNRVGDTDRVIYMKQELSKRGIYL